MEKKTALMSSPVTPTPPLYSTARESIDKEAALILSGDGTICSVLHATFDIAPNDTIDSLWPKDTCAHIRSNLRQALRNRKFFCEELVRDDSGESVEFTYIAQGRDRAMLVARELTGRRKSLTNLRRLAFIDEATALPNREFFSDQLKRIVEHQSLREGRVAVICCHIDDLDLRHGKISASGYDAILLELGARLVNELRGANSGETAEFERRTVVARIDFQRFGIVLPSIETGTDAESVADRLTQSLQIPVEIDGRQYGIRAHSGISLFPQDGSDAKTLHSNAIAALEEARSGQPGSIAFHSGTVMLRTLQRQDLEVELRSALERGAFVLNFLPMVDPETNEVRIIEALLRWPESVMGSHTTSDIIELAERTGLIIAIGEWVLRESFDQLKSWQDAGWTDLRVAVNLSMQEFSRMDIATRMAAMILQVGIQPSDIELEITEKMVARDAVAGYKAMDALRELGVRLVLDDFGTGMCSLAQLAHSPVDGIKIDNSLVAGASSCEKDRAACEAAISGAHIFGLVATAEGVETQEQADLLRQLGCDLLQGFHVAKPMSSIDMHSFLMARKGVNQP
jgi:predicted signal transduction protein with EAL and GGDEF domain